MTKTADELTLDDMWAILKQLGVSEQTLGIVTSINGYSAGTLADVLYAATGYNYFDQLDLEAFEI